MWSLQTSFTVFHWSLLSRGNVNVKMFLYCTKDEISVKHIWELWHLTRYSVHRVTKIRLLCLVFTSEDQLSGVAVVSNDFKWNMINLIFTKIIFLNIVVGIWLTIICYLAKISQKRYILHWFQYRNSYFEHPSVSDNGTRSAKMACCSSYIWITSLKGSVCVFVSA